MPYRDPARRAAWMREYRKRKNQEDIPASKRAPVYPMHKSVNTVPAPFIPTESRDLETREKSIQLPRAPVYPRDISLDFSRKPVTKARASRAAVLRFKTALDLFRPFPVGEMASRVCAYCYNTGESSPGTPCAYCAIGHK
jgi:hypothetical protein